MIILQITLFNLPVITHPGDTYLSVNLTSFNILAGVSAHDKNGDELSFTASTNLSLGIMGTYTITYSATDKYGNTSAASIPIALDEMMEQKLLKRGMKVLCVGFGAGLTWSGALIEI